MGNMLHEGALAIYEHANGIEIQRGKFAETVNKRVFGASRIYKYGFVPDGYRIDEELETVFVYEVENTKPLDAAKMELIVWFWFHIDGECWDTELICIGRDGRVVAHWDHDALTTLYMQIVKRDAARLAAGDTRPILLGTGLFGSVSKKRTGPATPAERELVSHPSGRSRKPWTRRPGWMPPEKRLP